MEKVLFHVIIDTSGSMAGDSIAACSQFLHLLKNNMLGMRGAAMEVCVQVAEFDRDFRVHPPMQIVELGQFDQIRTHSAPSHLGSALLHWNEHLKQDNPTFCLVLTDGKPTDLNALNRFALLRRQATMPQILMLLTGTAQDADLISSVSDQVHYLNDFGLRKISSVLFGRPENLELETNFSNELNHLQLPPPPPEIPIVF